MEKNEPLLKKFFATQHRKWKDKAYTLIHFTCKASPIVSNYGKHLRAPDGEQVEKPSHPHAYHPKGD